MSAVDNTSSQTESDSHQPPSEIQNFSLVSEGVSPFKVEWKKIHLPPILTLEHLSELHQQLQQYRGSRVQLIGKEVERIDTAALQLLIAFINHPQITVGWIEPSPPLCMAAQLIGLSSHLGLPRCEPSAEVT